MALFEWTLALLLGAVILTGVARRVGVPYPSLLAIAGAALAFVPAGPELEIEPDLALALFVAPVLLDAAFDTSPRDLRRNVIPLASLVVVAVGLTTAAVAWVKGELPPRARDKDFHAEAVQGSIDVRQGQHAAFRQRPRQRTDCTPSANAVASTTSSHPLRTIATSSPLPNDLGRRLSEGAGKRRRRSRR
jgi:hypothetical protein